MAQNQEPQSSQPSQDSGRVLGMVGLVLAIIPCTWFIGLVVSVIAFGLSRTARVKNTPAQIGIILGVVYLVLTVILMLTGVIPAWLAQFREQ